MMGSDLLFRLTRGSSDRDIVLQLENEEIEVHISRISDSPCRIGCPAGVNVKGYVGLISCGEFERALSVVRERNPLPGICGRVCTHPCESECRRGEIDEPVAIRQLKRFIADYALNSPPAVLPETTPKLQKRIAIVGSGPAGLTAANDLRRMGYEVTIFEGQSQPGGMLVWGIPPFRLPRNVIEEEINSILHLGIRLELNSRINEPAQLLRAGFAAVFWAPGCQQSIKLGLPLEEELGGIIDSLTFLRKSYQGEIRELNGRVLIIGGGDSAVDAARVARRLGAWEVVIVYRRTRAEMPAAEEEVQAALEEGVRFEFLTQPVGFISQGVRLSGLRCVRCQLGEPDTSGRRKPVPILGSEFIIDANLVITALGQQTEIATGDLPAGVFVGGDAAGGPATVIDAIASGHKGANAIHNFLTSELPDEQFAREEFEVQTALLNVIRINRARAQVIPLSRRRGFEEIEKPFTSKQAIAEAQRCLRCGPCAECLRCSDTCPRQVWQLKITKAKEPLLVRVHGINPVRGEQGVMVAIKDNDGVINGVLTPLVVTVEKILCRGCGYCVKVCPYQAINLIEWYPEVKTARVDVTRCRGCGNCIPVCPTGAVNWSKGSLGPNEGE